MTILDHPRRLLFGSATRQGLRTVAADAVAVRDGVAAVADGIGDTAAAALAAQGAVDVAVHVAASGRGPLAAVLAAAAAVRAAPAAGDAVLVVAAARPDGWDVAWVGDAAALLHDGRVVRPVTHEHTVAAQLRAQGVRVARRWENVVTTSLRTVRPDAVGTASSPAGTLLLLSDGVHRTLEPGEIARIVSGSADPQRAAQWLVDAALAAGARDNATAAVLAG
ncbi:PP2C family protein-serine/threonine phosphatase [Pseudonocardia sp. CA-107938]|uniref:PP2C family protein-serine/threonine phosphatase n=1 Tax=Pseudonocardia sp. CA-107938 TaxID=3240021 RepID=UPI003D8AF7A3